MRFFILSISFLMFFCVFNILSQTKDILWTFELKDASFGNAVSGDIDQDGKTEIVFSTYRNDSTVYALNAEDGSLLWKYNTGGCNDAAPLIYDVDNDGKLEVVVASSCVPKTFCFEGATGVLKWVAALHGSDSPPSAADIDGDDKPETLHGNFGGYVTCLNGEDGSISWDLLVDSNSWIQTAPLILDANSDGQLDFVVANWSFGTNHKIFCYNGKDHSLLWESDLPNDYIYHGGAAADLDSDGEKEIIIGCYDGVLRVLSSADGSLSWDFSLPGQPYIAAPVSIADLDNDGKYEIIVFADMFTVVLSYTGTIVWQYRTHDNSRSFRGAALSDVNNDNVLDVIFGTKSGQLIALDGNIGTEIFTFNAAEDYGKEEFAIDHGPITGDFNGDSNLDVFFVGGHSEYPEIEKNYGRAYALSLNVPLGEEIWPVFRQNARRTATIRIDENTYIENSKSTSNRIKFSPNPAADFITISGIAQINDIKIYDVLGVCVSDKQLFFQRTVYDSECALKIDISSLQTGLYYIRIGSKTYKFIKI